MKTKALFYLTLFFTLFMVSCKPAQKISYNTNNIQKYHESSKVSLSVQQFEDIRSQSEISLAQRQAKDVVQKINGQNNCINADKYYKVPVGLQMADIFAKHLNQKTYFADVFVDQKEKTDYYITAKIKHFYGIQKFSTKAAVGAGFGLIGAIATAGLKTEGNIIIELSDVSLYDKENNLIASLGGFKKEYSGEFPVDANCYCIYQNINQRLMDFNEELAQALFQEVKNSQVK